MEMGKHGYKKKLPPLPGTYKAKDIGCNCHLRRIRPDGSFDFDIQINCPLHGLNPPNDAPFKSGEEALNAIRKQERMMKRYSEYGKAWKQKTK
jgi:hypothetical protein